MIYTECKSDTTLVKKLGMPKKQIIHQQGKSEVCKELEKKENWIGMVDEDPFSVQPTYLQKLEETENLSNYGLRVLKDNAKNNDLIVLCPRLEEWIIKASEDAGIDIKRYNLPDDGEKLHKVINLDLRKFERLVNDLKGKSKMLGALDTALKKQR